ncbi:MAG: HAMP domain-containing protein, partial [Elusimicrobiota bacterium]
MKLNIATKINLLTVSLIVIFTSFLGWLFVRHETSAIKTELDERAITIVNNLAYNSEYGVLVGDKEGLIRLLEGIIKEKDISYAIIEDVKGDLIAEVGEKEKVLIKEFTAPIVAIQLSKDAGKEELSIIPEIREKGKEKKLGMVRLGVSLRGLYQKTTQIKKVMLFSVIVIILISSLVVIFAVRFLITRPLKPLMLGVEKIRTGDLSHRVKIKSQDELGEFANSFNKMTEDLSRVTVSKDYVDNIIKSMIDTLIVTDAKGKIKTVNQATLNLLGYEEE